MDWSLYDRNLRHERVKHERGYDTTNLYLRIKQLGINQFSQVIPYSQVSNNRTG